MTIEEKARAYDEALSKAREYHFQGQAPDKLAELESIFPQLRESENERIRKELIQFLTDVRNISESGRTSWAVRKEDAEMCNGFITYLKKQKEQKPETFNEPYNPDDYEVVMEGNATSLKRKEQKSVDYDHEMWKNCEANFEGGKKEVIEHPEKYGLQKPAEWSEKDEYILKNIRDFVKENTIIPNRINCAEECLNWIDALPERFNSKKA